MEYWNEVGFFLRRISYTKRVCWIIVIICALSTPFFPLCMGPGMITTARKGGLEFRRRF